MKVEEVFGSFEKAGTIVLGSAGVVVNGVGHVVQAVATVMQDGKEEVVSTDTGDTFGLSSFEVHTILSLTRSFIAHSSAKGLRAVNAHLTQMLEEARGVLDEKMGTGSKIPADSVAWARTNLMLVRGLIKLGSNHFEGDILMELTEVLTQIIATASNHVRGGTGTRNEYLDGGPIPLSARLNHTFNILGSEKASDEAKRRAGAALVSRIDFDIGVVESAMSSQTRPIFMPNETGTIQFGEDMPDRMLEVARSLIPGIEVAFARIKEGHDLVQIYCDVDELVSLFAKFQKLKSQYAELQKAIGEQS